MIDNFKYDSNFNPQSNFTRVKFGHDRSVLETELNEMQILQENSRLSLTRRLMPSGFMELVQKEFNGPAVVYNPLIGGLIQTNKIAIAPSRAMVNGYELNLSGNFTFQSGINTYSNYILVDLEESPKSDYQEDLVYVEVWLQYLSGDDNIKKWGYDDGEIINNFMVDPRIKLETSRRVGLCWNVRVAHNIDFAAYPDGFGYIDNNQHSPITAIANETLGVGGDVQLIYANASHNIFKNCEFYKDNNLWVAGRPNYKLSSEEIFSNYIFALPMFKVIRRNNGQYSIENFNGAPLFNNTTIVYDSSIKGDLNSGIRPDKLYCDFVVADDLVDIRKTISVKEFSSEFYLNKTLKNLFTGKLKTKDSSKMKRIQFGNAMPDYNSSNVVFVDKFDNSISPVIKDDDGSLPDISSNKLTFKNNLGGYGLLLNGRTTIKYNVPRIDVRYGTIDFYIQPYWYGHDDINQTIFFVKDVNDNIIFKLYKQDRKLIFDQYYNIPNGAFDNIQIINTVIDLSTNLMLAKNIYHIRLSWTSDPKINSSFMYINGKLCAKNNYIPSLLTPAKLVLGEIQNEITNDGFILENFVIYNCAFEHFVSDKGILSIRNTEWTGLPQDFIDSNSSLLPSFNSIVNNVSDNLQIQKNVIAKLSSTQKDSNNKLTFVLNTEYNIDYKDSNGEDSGKRPIIYSLSDGHVILAVDNSWSGLDTNQISFSIQENVNDIIVQYDIVIPSGNGSMELPNDILSAGLITNDSIQEISFNRKNTNTNRLINFMKPRNIGGSVDYAEDLPIIRDNDKGYARILHYYFSGNGTENYTINRYLYGYEVLGVINVSNERIISCQKDTINNIFTVSLSSKISQTETLEFVLALGGMSFEYETQTKTLLSNIHTTKMLTILGSQVNVQDNTCILPCFDTDNPHDGILNSVIGCYDNVFDTNGNLTQNKYNLCYVDHNVFYTEDIIDPKNSSKTITVSNIATYTVDPSSFGTPFIKLKFSWTPKINSIIEIPVFVSYQPLETDNISIWYDYVPYQGLLSNAPKKLKRISDWKYFITTLSSGMSMNNSDTTLNADETNINSLNNLVNRLPGGLVYSYVLDGDPIQFNYLPSSMFNNKDDIDTRLIFVKDAFLSSTNNQLDKSFFELDTEFIVSKTASGFQDGQLIIQCEKTNNDNTITLDNESFKIYFSDCAQSINKYTGMACLVLDENGELMLFVIGCLNNNQFIALDSSHNISSNINMLTPTFGDLFKIPGSPTTIKQY